jgi:alpha-glucosidase
VGPVKLSEYENEIVRNPVVFKTLNDNYFAIHEAAIFEYAPFVLTNHAGKNRFTLTQFVETGGKATRTSWRAFILGKTPGDLIESNLLVNLNEPCKIEDVSWIKPGRSMWDWRVWGYTAADGFEYGLNTKSHKRFIDFASKNNIQYLLIDADWYGSEFSEESDPTTTREGVNIVECMAYAKEKNIGVILYLNDVGAKKFGLERVLKQFSDWGAAGVKYGFMRGSWKEKVLNTRKIVELCAKYKLIVDFHDNPVPPSGDRRTWPNLITKEFGHSQADALRSYFPETIVTAPFVNMLAGPLDLCNGWFALDSAFGNGRHKVFEPIPGTVAAEVAKLIVIYGGLFVLPDAPEEYLKKDDLFECVRQMPAHFESYKVLDGKIGEFITVARKSGDEWFVGSLTNRDARELPVNFGFLDANKKYIATFYEDTPETNFMKDKEVYRIRKNIQVNKNSLETIKLAAGGGNAIWIRPVN